MNNTEINQLTQEQIKKIICKRVLHLLIEVDPIKIVHQHIMDGETRPLTKLETQRTHKASNRIYEVIESLSKGNFAQLKKKNENMPV